MDKQRYSEWVEGSTGLIHIEMLLLHYAQGLGLLDVELIEEFPKLKINSELEQDCLKKLKHITISNLWVMGAYELTRLITEIISKRKNININENAKSKLKEVLGIFNQIRVPITKFQEPGKERDLYSQIADSYFDPIKGIGWKIYSIKKINVDKFFYRKDLGDSLLELLKKLKEKA